MLWVGSKRCTFEFTISSKYVDEVTCEVVPLDICQVILGSPYLYDRYDCFDRRERVYEFKKDGMDCEILVETPPLGYMLVTTTQAKRLVNASKGCLLLLIREKQDPKAVTLSTLPQPLEPEIEELQINFVDVFRDVDGLPPQRAVEHKIQLEGNSPLPNSGLYHTSIMESEEIKK